VNLAEFKKIVAEWPDHEDAEVWIETGRSVTNEAGYVKRLNGRDMLIESSAFDEDSKHLAELRAAAEALRAVVPATHRGALEKILWGVGL
jgi:hypothetical protein